METSKWNGLDFYYEGQALYGRNLEISRITNAIDENIQTIIYGQSGVGKSSLLNAGLFPKLRDLKYFPVVIRFDGLSTDTDFEDFIISKIVTEALSENEFIKKSKFIFNNSMFQYEGQGKLWFFLNTTKFCDCNESAYIPVLVFDQFEELLNNYKFYNKSIDLIRTIYNLIDGTSILPESSLDYTNYRFVFSIREDFLYKLEDIIDRYNLAELRTNRFRIRALSHDGAEEIMKKTFSPVLVKRTSVDVFKQILNVASNELGEVNTLVLSLSCTLLEENSHDFISHSDVADVDQLIYSFYLSKISFLPLQTRRYLENNLVTKDGRRDSIDYIVAIEGGKITPEEISKLATERIIRITAPENGMKRIEFIHDAIAKVVSKKNISKWDIFKNLYKDRKNFSGRIGLEEIDALSIPSMIYIIMILFIVVLNLNTIFDGSLHLKEKVSLAVLDVIFLLLSFRCIKTYISASVKRCHDVDLSGWYLLYPSILWKLNRISTLRYYKPKFSYYYTNCDLDHYRYAYSISRLEYLTILAKLLIVYVEIECIVICVLVIFMNDLAFPFERIILSQAVFVFIMLSLVMSVFAYKRLIRMKFWPLLAALPVIGLLIPCFKMSADNIEPVQEKNYSVSFLIFFILVMTLSELLVFLFMSKLFH